LKHFLSNYVSMVLGEGGDEMKTPDQVVADRIIQEFRERQLLSEKGIQKIGSLLPSGLLKSEDWGMLFETDRLEKETDNADKSQ
jgi:hypothetical protein